MVSSHPSTVYDCDLSNVAWAIVEPQLPAALIGERLVDTLGLPIASHVEPAAISDHES